MTHREAKTQFAVTALCDIGPFSMRIHVRVIPTGRSCVARWGYLMLSLVFLVVIWSSCASIAPNVWSTV